MLTCDTFYAFGIVRKMNVFAVFAIRSVLKSCFLCTSVRPILCISVKSTVEFEGRGSVLCSVIVVGLQRVSSKSTFIAYL